MQTEEELVFLCLKIYNNYSEKVREIKKEALDGYIKKYKEKYKGKITSNMMKVFICPGCGWIRLVSRRSVVECHKCGEKQMKLSNLTMKQYSDMSEQERNDYRDGWMYIHSRKRKVR